MSDENGKKNEKSPRTCDGKTAYIVLPFTVSRMDHTYFSPVTPLVRWLARIAEITECEFGI